MRTLPATAIRRFFLFFVHKSDEPTAKNMNRYCKSIRTLGPRYTSRKQQCFRYGYNYRPVRIDKEDWPTGRVL